jgi:protein phosphatase
MSMTSAHATNPGLVRQNNEDYIRTDDSLGIYLLADGMGGHNAGEVASALAVDTVYAALSSNIANTVTDGLFDLMVNAVFAANSEVNNKARTNLLFMGMGTTLVVAVLRENTAYIAHAGDSRAYLFRKLTVSLPEGNSRLHRITNDHTMGDQLLANGIAREQIQEKQFHTLTQAVGIEDPPIPDFNTVKLQQGDMLLLCSDGLTDMLTDTEIESILSNRDSNLDALARELIDSANANGGHDNISVVLIRDSD